MTAQTHVPPTALDQAAPHAEPVVYPPTRWALAGLGAGLAGLTAASTIRRLHPELSILVLEGSQRIGGRVHTVYGSDGRPIELGAEFVHGDAPVTTRLRPRCCPSRQ